METVSQAACPAVSGELCKSLRLGITRGMENRSLLREGHSVRGSSEDPSEQFYICRMKVALLATERVDLSLFIHNGPKCGRRNASN